MAQRLLVLLILIIVCAVLYKPLKYRSIAPEHIDAASIQLGAALIEPTHGTRQLYGRAPGYPGVLALIAATSDSARQGLRCLATPSSGCESGRFLQLVIWAHTVMELLALALVGWIAFLLSGSNNVAVLTVALSYWATQYGTFILVARPYVALHLVSHAFLAVTLWALRRRAPSLAFAGGGLLAVAAAFEPPVLVAAPVVVGLACFCPHIMPGQTKWSRALWATAFACGCAITVGSQMWVAQALGYPLEQGASQVANQLAQRVAFNAIDVPTWLTGLFQPLPIIGRAATWIASEADLRKLGYDVPGAFVFEGSTRLRNLAMAGGRDGPAQLHWLFDTFVIGQWLAFLISFPIVFWRGLWGGVTVLTMIGLLSLPQMLRWARAENRHGLVAMAVWPVLAILLANSVLTPNLFVWNPLLPSLYCFALAYIARSL